MILDAEGDGVEAGDDERAMFAAPELAGSAVSVNNDIVFDDVCGKYVSIGKKRWPNRTRLRISKYGDKFFLVVCVFESSIQKISM